MSEPEVQPSETTEVAVRPSDAPVSLTDAMSTQQLRGSIKTATTQRELIAAYVKDHLVEGIDYGTIEDKDKGFKSKPTLYKPGQEKIFSLMNLTSRLERDTETIEMLPDEKGLVAYLCRVYRKGEEIAQGRGAAKVGDKKRDANATIKIAEKRARMDACLSLGFSEFFTQDLEDPEYRGNGGDKPARPASDKQKDFLRTLVKEALSKLDPETITNKFLKDFYTANGVADPANITLDEASKFIEALKANKAVWPSDDDTPDDTTPPPAAAEPEEGEIVEEPANATEAAPKPVVGAQFYKDVETKFAELGMSVKDQMRFYESTWGKPFPPAKTPSHDGNWIIVDNQLNKLAHERGLNDV